MTWLLALLALPPAVLLVMGGAGLVLRWDDRRAEAASRARHPSSLPGVRCACGLMQTGRPRSGMDELVHGAEVCQPEREWLP